MLISCIQMNPQNDLKKNLNLALKLVSEAAKAGAEIVVLPEMFTYMGEENLRKHTKNKMGEGVFEELKTAARELSINLVAGSHSEEIKDIPNKIYNTCVTFNKKGEIISTYRKQHLFNLKDKNGNPLYCESDSFEPGNSPQGYTIDTNEGLWNALNIICYDLRFPEIIRHNVTKKIKPYDIVFVPAAFTWQTGKDHWEILLRARAIENQCYIVACNQTGSFFNGKKKNYGNSMVIDPWGQIVAKMGEECGILSTEIHKELIDDSRTRLPALSDRKIL
jgi:deaminated glutathione amidase